MTATARSTEDLPGAADRRVRAAILAAGLVTAGLTAPAGAQVSVEVALQTDFRVRGHSVSDGQPAASLSLAYDDPSGAYLGAAAIGTVRGGEPALLGVQANLGYAARLGPSVSIDGGVAKTQYFQGYGTRRDYDHTELYLGLSLPVASARLSYSPDYYRNGADTLYAEFDTGIEPAPGWLLSAHAGMLSYLDTPPFYTPRRTFDWRIGATRQFGPWGLHLDLSGRVQGRAHYAVPGGAGSGRDPAAAVLGLTRAL